MSSISLQAENLHVWRGERHVLRGVNLHVRGGEVLQITGANGAGKTSLLRTLCTLVHPEEGRVLWGGQDVQQDLPSFHASVAYVGHEPPLEADLTPRENLRYWVGIRRRLNGADIQVALERVGADHWRDRPVRTLSAGQKRRVAIAGLALLAAPLWVLDEPTTNLDVDGQKLVGQLIGEQAAQGGAVIAAVHHELSVLAVTVRRLELAGE